MENELELKWRRIQQAMRQEEADGCLLTMNMNLYYVSGQVFNGYFYLPAEGRPYWFVKRLTVPETNQVHVIRKPEQMPELFLQNHFIGRFGRFQQNWEMTTTSLQVRINRLEKQKPPIWKKASRFLHRRDARKAS